MREQRARILEEAATSQLPDDASWDDEREIRYSLTALGESTLTERGPRSRPFPGFGPCIG